MHSELSKCIGKDIRIVMLNTAFSVKGDEGYKDDSDSRQIITAKLNQVDANGIHTSSGFYPYRKEISSYDDAPIGHRSGSGRYTKIIEITCESRIVYSA